ncbi:MAG TPA: LamG-like jellyroll fold domain-containing protein, partial [Spirillospora sp.]|nr:LamG-like jellyroll fold domain-containing protein [Spirillospora sp.]
GRSWTAPAHMTYTPGGRKVKHPRAANFVRRFSNGKYIYWFHNNGQKWYNHGPARGSRNVAWLLGGIEKDGYIHWSQPEILLYEPDEFRGPSYPDFVEENGRYFVSATQKTTARIHEIDPTLLEMLWNQADLNTLIEDGLVLHLSRNELSAGGVVELPELPDLSEGGGFSLDFRVRFDNLAPGQVLLDGRDAAGRGFWLATTDRETLQIHLRDHRMEAAWDTDAGVVQAGQEHHIAVIVDGGPRIISFVVDGLLCDGGESRPYGWGRFNRYLQNVSGAGKLTIAPSLNGQLNVLRLYNRYLRTSEAISNYRSGQ